jgi:hypothetical protein
MHVLIASATGIAAVLLPTAAMNVARGWWRQRRALRFKGGKLDG